MHDVAISADSVPICYEVHGTGRPALVFVHGWSCDRSYWDRQVHHFAPQYQVVALDLAGHGESGLARTTWAIPAFGEDVVTVVEKLGLEHIVLIGHSMGGSVIVDAARRMPDRVVGLVGVDTFQDVEQTRTRTQIDAFLTPFRANFVEATRTFVRERFVPNADAALVEQIVTDMSAAHPEVGIGALEGTRNNDLHLRTALQEAQAPIMAINSDYQPTNMEAAQRYGIAVVLMSGVGHFVMLEDAETFNGLLDEAIKKFVRARASA